MNAQDIAFYFEVIPGESLRNGCELKCPSCKGWAIHTDWIETTVPCDLCSEHTAMRCPNCYEDFDHVHSKPFECRVTEVSCI